MSRKKKKNIIIQKQKITGLGSLGKGFVKTDDNKIIFAKYGVPGDIVDINIKKKRTSYLEGDIVKITSIRPISKMKRWLVSKVLKESVNIG